MTVICLPLARFLPLSFIPLLLLFFAFLFLFPSFLFSSFFAFLFLFPSSSLPYSSHLLLRLLLSFFFLLPVLLCAYVCGVYSFLSFSPCLYPSEPSERR